jgi:hypothetical protein
MEKGLYLVKSSDLPVYEIYQCNSHWTELCIRSLHAGELNGSRTASVNDELVGRGGQTAPEGGQRSSKH